MLFSFRGRITSNKSLYNLTLQPWASLRGTIIMEFPQYMSLALYATPASLLAVTSPLVERMRIPSCLLFWGVTILLLAQ